MEIRQGRSLYDSGDFVPLFFPVQDANSVNCTLSSEVKVLFSCSGQCVGSLVNQPISGEVCPSFFLTVNYFLTNPQGSVTRTLPVLARNLMISVREPTALSAQPVTGVRISSASTPTSIITRRKSKRHATR